MSFKFNFSSVFAAIALIVAMPVFGQSNEPVQVTVTIENIAPPNGVAITPVWVGFHSGSFDSYNGGTLALEGLERIAEDGNTGLLTTQFNDFDQQAGGYTYIDNSTPTPTSSLVRTGDLTDAFRQDATLGAGPLLPGQSATEKFLLRNDGSNDFFSYASMILPTNDFFMANGNPVAHDISEILMNGGEIAFLIGTPNGGVNDAGTERENFLFSAGNGLFSGRNLLRGQVFAGQGQADSAPIANVIGNPFGDFSLVVGSVLARANSSLGGANRRLSKINVGGLDFNQYKGGIAAVSIVAE